MANELQVSYDVTGVSVYYLVRNATGSIWQTTTSTFVGYSSANLVNYTIAAAEQGVASRYYTATFPAAASGIYYTLAKLQAGASAAETDLTIGAGILHWDGTLVVGLTSVPALVFRRNMTSDEGSAAVLSLCSVVLKLAGRFVIDQTANTATTYRSNATTVHMTQTLTKDSTLVPIKSLTVGA